MTKVGIQCPKCQKRYQVAPETIGKRVKCGGLHHRVCRPATSGPTAGSDRDSGTSRTANCSLRRSRPRLPRRDRPQPPRGGSGQPVSSLDALFDETFPGTTAATDLSSGPSLSAGLNFANQTARPKPAIPGGTLVKVMLIAWPRWWDCRRVGRAAGLVGRDQRRVLRAHVVADARAQHAGHTKAPATAVVVDRPVRCAPMAPPPQLPPPSVVRPAPAAADRVRNNCRELLASCGKWRSDGFDPRSTFGAGGHPAIAAGR